MEIDTELLKKYYQGLCTPEEQAAVEAWQVSAEDIPEQLDDAERASLEPEIWQHLQQSLHLEQEDTSPLIKTKSPRVNWKRIYGTAAAIGLLVSIAGVLLLKKQPAVNNNKTIAYQIISTHRSEKTLVQLEDGTRVMLNSESTLRYPAHFTDTSRLVYLTGEAYFQVAKDHKRPFSILTAKTKTQVLGTVFDLKAYPGEVTSLAVEEGRVRFGAVNSPRFHQLFTRGQYGDFNPNGQLIKTILQTKVVAPWKDGHLMFKDEPLALIIPVLQRWYNVNIKVGDKALLKQKFTGDFNNPSISFLLDRMSFVFKFHYTIQQQTVQILPNK